MNVSGINSTAFTGQTAKKADKNNNLCRKIGTGLGVGGAAYGVYDVYKSGVLQQVKSLATISGVSKNKMIAKIAFGVTLTTAGYIAVGRWLGAGVDAVIGKANSKPKEEPKCAHAVA